MLIAIDTWNQYNLSTYLFLETQQVSAKSQSTKKAAEERSSDVQAAIAAVDAAAAKLPPQEALKFSVLAVDPGGGWNQRGSDAPPNPGSKVVFFLNAKGLVDKHHSR